MRSFSSAAKAELCEVNIQNQCCVQAECFGILLFCNTFRFDGIKIITESAEFAGMLPKLFKRAFGFGFDVQSGEGGNEKFQLKITDPAKIAQIMELYGFGSRESLSLHVNYPIVENDCCKLSFLRGAFLAGGSVSDPAKSYHIEFVTTHQSVARECELLVQETMGFSPKLASRSGSQVIYLKQYDQICNLLGQMGAGVAYMGFIEAKLERDLNNRVNRRCNCDDANITKVIDASREHLNAIRILRERGLFDSLPEKMKQAALVREENPEAPLSELGELMNPKLSKPAMNHRLKRLVELAKETEQ